MKTHGRRTKIIATIGSALLAKQNLEKALPIVDALRFNFSHFTPESAAPVLRRIEAATTTPYHNVALIADLKGPEIRSDHNSHLLKKNKLVLFYCQTAVQQANHPAPLKRTQFTSQLSKANIDPQNITACISINHPRLHTLVAAQQIITAADGNIACTIIAIAPKVIIAKVTIGGTLSANKTINVPDIDFKLNILDARDKATLNYVCRHRFNWIAASFINTAKDILTIRQFIKNKNPDLRIIAKIETKMGMKNIAAIIKVADGIMVARGDLGENFSYEQIPLLQEKLLEKTQAAGKVIIIATQMLETLITHPKPKRPEVTDVATAARARVDAVMLSAETAIGKFPLKAIEVMHNIIKASEENWAPRALYTYHSKEIIFPIIKQALELAHQIAAPYLIAITTRGKSPRLLAALRARTQCIVACYHKSIFERSYLYYAVSPVLIDQQLNKEQELKFILERYKIFKKNQNIVFVFGYPFKLNPTNTIRWLKVP